MDTQEQSLDDSLNSLRFRSRVTKAGRLNQHYYCSAYFDNAMKEIVKSQKKYWNSVKKVGSNRTILCEQRTYIDACCIKKDI